MEPALLYRLLYLNCFNPPPPRACSTPDPSRVLLFFFSTLPKQSGKSAAGFDLSGVIASEADFSKTDFTEVVMSKSYARVSFGATFRYAVPYEAPKSSFLVPCFFTRM